MKKLYIPTTSLNFNNILSTESISPKGFYALRGFGYSRWFTIPENDLDGVILLYESPAVFVRSQSDMEDHPLLIEIETDEDFPIAMDGVRYSKHSIYLNPWNTRFIFLNEKDRTVAYSLSDSSSETKMLRLYKKKIVVESMQGSFPMLKDLSGDLAMETSFIEQDRQINKIKGLLYGYYIGVCLSSSKNDIEQINILKEIQNIFASVVSSPEGTPSQGQLKRLENLFTSYVKLEPLYQDLLAITGSTEKTEEVLLILPKYGLPTIQNDWKRIVAELQYNREPNNVIAWVKSKISSLKQKMASCKALLSPDKEELITNDGKVSKVTSINNEEGRQLYISWVNNVLIESRFNGKVSSIKEELADAITLSAKDTLGASWQDSLIRTFLNQLRKHIRGLEFTQPWNNGVLSSIAAVIVKGDDWESLLNFMQSKGMTDYRLAFSFYGMLNGFANLTRDFTDLLLNEESHYVANVYREFYGQLHGITIDQSGKEVDVIPTDDTEKRNSTDQQKAIIWNFFETFAPKSGKTRVKLEKGLRLCLERYSDNIDYSQFIMDLNDYDDLGWGKRKKKWKTMQEHFYPDYNKDIVGLNNREASLFDGVKDNILQSSQIANDNSLQRTNMGVNIVTPVCNTILEDTTWIHECTSLISDSKALKQFVEDMKWFVENHNETYHDKKKGTKKGFYYGENRINDHVIKRLKKYMENKLRPQRENMEWLSEIYANIPIDKIIDYISNKYGI